MPTLYLLRHAQVVQRTPRRYIGTTDIALDDTGREQARAMAAHLQSIHFDHAWCSDLSRTQKTADIILSGRDVKLTPTPLLREICLGKWEGMTTDEVKKHWPGEFEARGNDFAGYHTPGGESFADVQARAIQFLDSIKNDTGTILAVAHGGFNRALLCHVTGTDLNDLFSIRQDYCCVNLLEHENGWQVSETGRTL